TALLIATALFAATAAPGLALESAKITIKAETGGVPTRFTFVAALDGDGPLDSITFTYPENFELGEGRIEVVTLDGLKRIPVDAKSTVDGQQLTLDFAPGVPAGSNLRVEVFDVMTPIKGGEYPLVVSYSVAGQRRSAEGLSFSYETPPREEIIARALDRQAWVEQWNSFKPTGLFLKPQLIALSVPLLFWGWLYSISLVLFAFPLAIAGGLALAFAKMSKIAPVRWLASAYINVVRGTPLFLQIAVIFIGLRIAGIRVDDFASAIFVLALNSSAYLAEIFRAGIQSIHRGQFEAASSLGMTYRQAMQYVIIPQTVKRVLPTMTSEFILLFKDTAIFSAFGIVELMYRANSIVSRTGNLTPFVVAAVYYLLVTIPLINYVGSLERRLAVAEGGQAATGGRPKRGKLQGVSAVVDAYGAGAPNQIPSGNEGGS
ncbi:MAG: ABC transporter permease subunit, partial [Actinomycetota bacterium]|nr:ABC transporter permease subunit [Actinomycetota bacterium]